MNCGILGVIHLGTGVVDHILRLLGTTPSKRLKWYHYKKGEIT